MTADEGAGGVATPRSAKRCRIRLRSSRSTAGRREGRVSATTRITMSTFPSVSMPSTVGPAEKGAVTHPGGAAESHVYADL